MRPRPTKLKMFVRTRKGTKIEDNNGGSNNTINWIDVERDRGRLKLSISVAARTDLLVDNSSDRCPRLKCHVCTQHSAPAFYSSSKQCIFYEISWMSNDELTDEMWWVGCERTMYFTEKLRAFVVAGFNMSLFACSCSCYPRHFSQVFLVEWIRRANRYSVLRRWSFQL